MLDPRGLADVSVSENHIWSLLLHKVILSLEKFGINASKSSFLYYYNGAQKHEGFVNFENTCSRAKTYLILTSLNYIHFYARYCWWHQFLWWPRMHIFKVQKPCINRLWIAWFIHGFLPVKTWLLIACNTAFYAIMWLLHLFTVGHYAWALCQSLTAIVAAAGFLLGCLYLKKQASMHV